MQALLSYPISGRTPLYPGTAPVELESTGGGLPASTMVRFDTHSGTHLDAPGHFCPGGPTVQDVLLPLNDLFPAFCVDLPREGGVGIDEGDMDLPPGSYGAEALLLRTGMHRFRDKAPLAYSADHPFLMPPFVDWIVRYLPRLKVLGVDCISVAHPDHGKEAEVVHRALLCRKPPILIVEDMDLSETSLADGPFRLLLLPVVRDRVDGSPVVALAMRP